jgi:hypothetical protein
MTQFPTAGDLRNFSERSFMDFNKTTGRDGDSTVEDFAAELTKAAYPVMVRHGMVDNWLDVELELWRALVRTVEKWEREWPRAGVMLVCTLSPGEGTGSGPT